MSFPFYCIPHSHIRVQKSLWNNHVHRWCFLCFFFQVVVVHYSLPYASLKHEICEDGSMLCGMEIQLPRFLHRDNFSFERVQNQQRYQQAAFQAVHICRFYMAWLL